MSNARKYAAIAALSAHDALQEAEEAEPSRDMDADGMPIDPDRWLEWHANVYRPAYRRWSEAMDRLAVVLGESVSRHPYNFRPLCERIIEEAAVMREP